MEKNNIRSGSILEYAIHIIVWGIFFLQPLFFNIDREEPFNPLLYARFSVVPTTFCILFYLNYLLFVPRYLFKGRTRAYFIIDAVAIAVLLLLMKVWDYAITPPEDIIADLPPGPGRPPRMQIPFVLTLTRDIISMVLVSGVAASFRMGGRMKEVEEARKEAELTNLKNQINPHFLLNTLNNIYALISFDTDKAQTAVLELSRLLRYALYDIRQNFVPLYKEAEFIRSYVAIMQLRLSGNVEVQVDIDISPDSRTPVAPLLFISLIENAFKHGISPSGKNWISIRVFETEDEIHCEIGNSSHPKTAEDRSGSGIGLEQVQKRLDIMYEGKYRWDRGEDPEKKEYRSYLILKKE